MKNRDQDDSLSLADASLATTATGLTAAGRHAERTQDRPPGDSRDDALAQSKAGPPRVLPPNPGESEFECYRAFRERDYPIITQQMLAANPALRFLLR